MPETATVQIPMPEMGESVTEGIVLEWHVAEGDAVKEGDTIVEVSTDKVDAEVPAPMDGVITKIVAQVDDEVPVGAPLAEMEAGDGEGQSARPAGPAAAGDPPSPATTQETVPLRRNPPGTPLVGPAAPTVGQATARLMFVRRPLLGELPMPTALILLRSVARDRGRR
jgi:2-oxoglutarate dehydrogenase E1 component